MKVGYIVKLNPSSRWNNNKDVNPLDTEGVVTNYSTLKLSIEVVWNNGTSNNYDEVDLIVVSKPEGINTFNFTKVSMLNRVLVDVSEHGKGNVYSMLSDRTYARLNSDGEPDGFYVLARDMRIRIRKTELEMFDIVKHKSIIEERFN